VIVAVYALIATILFFDQLCKFLILKYIGLNTTYDIIKDIFSITPLLNTGGGFGILPGQTPFFILVSVFATVYIISILLKRKIKEKILLYSISMILAGALGNLIDRLRFGAVVDFIDFKIWPVFNIADSSITVGVIILTWQLLKSSKFKIRGTLHE